MTSRNRSDSSGPRRRTVLKRLGAVATVGAAGCLGRANPENDSTPTPGPEPPWTTEALAAAVPDGTELTIYAGTGNATPWEQLVDVINDEYGTTLQPAVFVSDGGKVSQRLIQERQAGRDQADVVSQATDISDMIHRDGPEVAGKYFELGLDEDYWFSDVLEDAYTEPWYVSAYNGGPSTAMAVNPGALDELGLDYPTDWNSLLDPQYAGAETPLPGYIVSDRLGWIIAHHAEARGMEHMAWIREVQSHLDFVGTESHTTGARAVGVGDYPFMFYNFPWVINRFTDRFPVEIHYPEGIAAHMSSGHVAVNKHAPNPWAARFVVSAALEPAVQRRMIGDIDEFTPGRLDLDYSDQDLDPYVAERLSADVTPISFWDEKKYVSIGEQAINDVIDV